MANKQVRLRPISRLSPEMERRTRFLAELEKVGRRAMYNRFLAALPPRSRNALLDSGIHSFEKLLPMGKYGKGGLMELQGMGERGARAIETQLNAMGLHLYCEDAEEILS